MAFYYMLSLLRIKVQTKDNLQPEKNEKNLFYSNFYKMLKTISIFTII
jgi:hypothetical protein